MQMDSSKKQQIAFRNDCYEDMQQDQILKLQKVQEYLSPQLNENRDVINKYIAETTEKKKQVKQHGNGQNQNSSRSDFQYTITQSKNFNRDQQSEFSQPPQQFLEQSNNHNQNQKYELKQSPLQQSEGAEDIEDLEARKMTIDALTTCIYSSITKNKMQEMKIQELENIINQIQSMNVQSTNFSNSIPLNVNSQNAGYSSNHNPSNIDYNSQQQNNQNRNSTQWQPSIYSSNIRKSPCQRHSNSLSKSPDIRHNFNKQNMKMSPMQQDTNEYGPQKNSYRSRSGDFTKDSGNISSSQNNEQQFRNGQNYQMTTSSAMGMRNEQIMSTSPTKSKSQAQFQNRESLNGSSNIVQMEYLSKVKFLEEAIEYKNKEIERLMVLTAASRRNDPRSCASSKSPERGRQSFDMNVINKINETNQDEDQKGGQLQLHTIITDLERKNAYLENELFNYKCQLEDKDKDILKIREQIDHLSNCTQNQMHFIQVNEDLELRLKEKDINEQNMLVQLEQQNLMIRNIEMDSIKKLEEYKDLIQRIQNQNVQELTSIQREKEDMQIIINKLESLLNQQQYSNLGNEEEMRKRASHHQTDFINQEQQRRILEQEQDILNLNEKINLQTQLINKQRQAVDTLKKEINDLQAEHENKIQSLLQQNAIYAQEKAKLQEEVRHLSINHEEQMITSHELLAEQQRQLQDMAGEREDLLRTRDEVSAQKQRINEERDAFEGEKKSFLVARGIYEQDREQLDLERKGLQLERNSLQRDCQVFERNRKQFEQEIDDFNNERHEIMQQQQQNQDIAELQQLVEEREEEIAYMKQQQYENKTSQEQLKGKIQAQIQSYEQVINQIQQQNHQLISERDALMQERCEDIRDNSEILELKKQLMYEGIEKQDIQQRLTQTMKVKEGNEELSKENSELKTTLEMLKQKIRGMQNIDDDIKEYINSMCKEKNNLQDRHVAHLEEIKNLKLQLKAVSLESKSLNLSIANLKEEIKLYKNQQTDIMLDEKNKKSFLRVHLQKKLNLLNAQLETYIRTTLDLDEIYYILLFNQQNLSQSFSSPQKPLLIQQNNQPNQGSSNGKTSQNRKSQDQSFNQSTPTSQNNNINNNTFQKNGNQQGEIDEKTQQKIEQLNNKRKKDLDKVYQIMEDFISLISNIQQ